jgi:penicillin-binding protein 2
MSIGQGAISATPLQALISYCIFANGGRLVQPHLLLHHKDAEGHRTEFVPKTRDTTLPGESRRLIMEGLKGVVNSSGGTAFQAGFSKEWKAAGKTGTAERPGRENDAWFVCFAPYDAPEVAVLVLIEEGGYGGATAAPLAREMLDYYFQNRTRLQGQ